MTMVTSMITRMTTTTTRQEAMETAPLMKVRFSFTGLALVGFCSTTNNRIEELELAVEKVQAQIGKRKIPLEVIEDTILDFDWDLRKAVAELCDQYQEPAKKKKPVKTVAVPAASASPAPSPAPTPKPKRKYHITILISYHHLSFFFLFFFFTCNIETQHTHTYTHQSMSKLASLAKKRALQKQLQSESQVDSPLPPADSISLLEKLQTKNEPVHPNQQSPAPSALSKLALRANKGKLQEKSSSALNSLRSRRDIPVSQSTLAGSTPAAPVAKPTPATVAKPRPKQSEPVSIFPEVDYSTPFLKRSRPSSLGLLFVLEDSQPNKRRKKVSIQYSNFLYPLASTPSVTPAFSKPSPDDIVTSAQLQAKFGDDSVSKSLSNLKIADKPLKYNVISEIAKHPDTKNALCFVVIGHVDAGKSTLMGRLLLDCGAVKQHTVDKYERASQQIGKQSFALAWVMDQTEDERSRGITVDVCTTTFETPKTKFTILDAPGHRDFVPNMIDGSSRADVALLVIDAAPNAFESGFFGNGQTREHAIVARSLGIERIVIAVNKMDLQNWDHGRFLAIQDQFTEFLVKLGFKKSNLSFVPCAGLSGENVVKQASNETLLSWYNGLTVLESLESIKLETPDFTKPFRMRIIDVDSVPHTSQVTVTGRIDSGTLQVNEQLLLIPSDKPVSITKIFSYTREGPALEWAKDGDYVELFVSGIDTADDIRHGDILCDKKNPVGYASKFVAKMTIFDTDKPILRGNKLVMHYSGSATEVRISKLVATLDKSGQVAKKKPMVAKGGQSVIVEVEVLEKKVPLERFKDNRDLGRIIFRREGITIGVGIVEELVAEEKKE